MAAIATAVFLYRPKLPKAPAPGGEDPESEDGICCRMGQHRHAKVAASDIKPRESQTGDEAREPQGMFRCEERRGDGDRRERRAARIDGEEIARGEPSHEERAPEELLHHRNDDREAGE